MSDTELQEPEPQESIEPIEEDTSSSPLTFIPPSISPAEILASKSYTYHSPIPAAILADKDTECVLGIDEAGRGPVLGPMVYGLFYLPLSLHQSLLADTHKFNDSKVLTPQFRSSLLRTLCTPDTDLYHSCGWATHSLSARSISSSMLKPASFNLNAQAMAATIALIREVLAKGVNVRKVFIDTIGKPEVYQRKLEVLFAERGMEIVVAKKADSLYPVVSAASVCAKVTRDVALEVGYRQHLDAVPDVGEDESPNGAATQQDWGSGYPSDARCINWLKGNLDPVFGWGPECRFSWGTVKDLLDKRDFARRVDWPEDDADGMAGLEGYFGAGGNKDEMCEITGWWGNATEECVI